VPIGYIVYSTNAAPIPDVNSILTNEEEGIPTHIRVLSIFKIFYMTKFILLALIFFITGILFLVRVKSFQLSKYYEIK